MIYDIKLTYITLIYIKLYYVMLYYFILPYTTCFSFYYLTLLYIT